MVIMNHQIVNGYLLETKQKIGVILKTIKHVLGKAMNKLFPTILITLDVLAAIVYFYCGDMRRAIYWGAAGILTAAVTF